MKNQIEQRVNDMRDIFFNVQHIKEYKVIYYELEYCIKNIRQYD